MDPIDAQLLDIIQKGLPLEPDPFDEVGARLSIPSSEVISRLSRLKADGIIRQISAIFDSAALGYRGALVAFKVREDSLDDVAASVAAHSGVSHCYARNAAYNLWFTITLPPELDMAREVGDLASADGVESHMILPAIKLFKIGVFLTMTDEPSSEVASSGRSEAPRDGLSPEDRAAVRALQADLPLVEKPFKELARREGMTEEELLRRGRRFIETGAMRRFAAVLRHTHAGYRANAMVCWRVEPEKMDEIGSRLASHPAVSHCYERPTHPDWPYGLYTMVHRRSEAELNQTIEELVRSAGVSDYLVLRSVKEYKKSRVIYFQ